MIIIVTDACFLIDLIDINLFEEFLGLGYQIHITSSVFAEPCMRRLPLLSLGY